MHDASGRILNQAKTIETLISPLGFPFSVSPANTVGGGRAACIVVAGQQRTNGRLIRVNDKHRGFPSRT